MTDDLYFNKSWVNPNKIKKLNTNKYEKTKE